MSLKLVYNNNEKEIVPIRFMKPEPFALDGIVSAQEVFINASSINGLGPGDRLVFTFGNEVVSMKHASLQFELIGDIGTTPAINGAFVPDIKSIFAQFRVIAGSITILDIADYGQLQNIFNYTFSELYPDSSGAVLTATNTDRADRETYFAGRRYCAKIGFASGYSDLMKQVLYLNKLGTDLRLEFTLAPAIRVISTSGPVTGTNPTYVLNQAELHYHALAPSEELNKHINNSISKVGFLPYVFNTWDRITDTAGAKTGATSFAKSLTFKYSNILAIVCVFEPTALLTNWEADEKRRNFFNPGLETFKLQINGTFHPNTTVQDDCDNYTSFLMTYGLSSQCSTLASKFWNYGNVSRASFIPCINLTKYVSNNYNKSEMDYENIGLDTSVSTNVQLNIGWSVGLPEDYTVSVYCYHSRTWAVNANGSSNLWR